MSTVKQPDCTIKTPPDHPRHEEEVLDEAIQETFPASDPVSVTIDRSPEERGQPSKLDLLDEAQRQREAQNREVHEKNETQPPTGDLVGRRPGNR